MTIEYYIKSVYGRDLIYIKDSFIRSTLQGLTGKKTLDSYDLTALENLGLTVKRVFA